MFASSDFVTDPALAGIAESLAALRAESRADWSTPARAARVMELGAAVEVLAAELVRAVAAFDAAGDHAADGALSAAAWIAHRVPMTRTAAARLVATARMTRRSEPLANALATGATTVSHVEQIARVVHKREDSFESHGDAVVNAAMPVTPEAFRACAAAWRSNVDDLIGEVDDPFDASRDDLNLSPTTGGLGVTGWFHTAAGIEIQNLIDSYDQPDPRNGERAPRTLAERRAAALYALLFDGRATAPKNIDITIDEATYRGEWTDDLTRVRSDVDGYGPVPPAWIRSWVTDAVLRRVVLADSEVLDLGRGTRFANRAQRRALRQRDRGCVVPGCSHPPNWTDAHHVVTYFGGGLSDLANYALVCRRHHRMLDRGWTRAQALGGGWTFDPPQDRAPPEVRYHPVADPQRAEPRTPAYV